MIERGQIVPLRFTVGRVAEVAIARVVGDGPPAWTEPDAGRAGGASLRRSAQPGILPEEDPPLAHGQDRFSLFAHRAQVANEIFQRVKGHLLAAPRDHFGRRVALGFREADLEELLARIRADGLVAPAPPFPRHQAGQHARLAAEGDVRRRHLRGHARHEIVGPDDALEELRQRRPHPDRAFRLRVEGVEEQD